MIEIRNIHKKYDNLEVLRGIDLHIPDHEIVTIVGASGAGKTTLLQIMGTLEKPTEGSIIFDGRRVDNLSDREMAHFRNSHIGFVFQFHQLLPEFTALENIMIPALIGGTRNSEAKQRAEKLLQYLGLTDRKNHKPAQLSGGEKQRIAVARALVNRPKVILADEPSGSLDTQNKTELHRLFFNLRKEYGYTFVIVTHDETLSTVADREIRLKDGIVIADTAQKQPADESTETKENNQ
ncbi:MAG TPA: ABC transporter ATP-binding protein [Candidatus Barnesiella excrementipullorum]|uniref:ABC transporter ATP-binding protein n=1 Tax=Candidatus Barnesiella excrementipullorum TaxID=2838479 RepID=A0A9D2AP01_9BACT|nr:ABC transporter ATP-binding protein [Candidatus Barnesiella excrementipullorum]